METHKRTIFLRESRRSGRSQDEERDLSQEYEDLGSGLTIYLYTAKEEEDFLNLAARCMISQAALATLNRLTTPSDVKPGGQILLPSVPGIFLPEEPSTDLEYLLRETRVSQGIPVIIRLGDRVEKFRFIPTDDFLPTERLFFLNPGFQFPLKNYRLTSGFGPRRSPITGRDNFHRGLDLAAPMGTEVYPAREGEVIDLGEDRIYGKYVMIRHSESLVSLYGHLSRIDTVLRKKVLSGNVIGRVGSTGLSTGPHLHFELRQFGRAQDPSKYLRIFQD